MQICKYCHESPTEWRSKNVCQACYLEQCRKRQSASRARRIEKNALEDPLIEPASVKPNMFCYLCSHIIECRDLVITGRQVLCAPVHESDLLIQRAYQARLEMIDVDY